MTRNECEANVQVKAGDDTLEQTMEATNTGNKPFELTAALHTYFSVSSIDKVGLCLLSLRHPGLRLEMSTRCTVFTGCPVKIQWRSGLFAANKAAASASRAKYCEYFGASHTIIFWYVLVLCCCEEICVWLLNLGMRETFQCRFLRSSVVRATLHCAAWCQTAGSFDCRCGWLA